MGEGESTREPPREGIRRIRARKQPRVPQPHIAWRAVHGVLLIDKPTGITSTATLARVRRALCAQKGGHTGTLDPMATGLLPLCFGEATKFASDLLDADKSYEATIRLGVVTDTGDADGRVLEERTVEVTRAAVDRALARFRGPIAQVPPMHSALKRDGRPLYEYARQGVTVERAARPVTIHRLEVVAFEGTSLSIAVDCSKGTYIRTLAEEIGEALGCGGHLVALRRVRAGSMHVDGAIALDAFEARATGERDAMLLPIDALIANLPAIELDAAQARRFTEGQRLAWPDASYQGRVRVYRAANTTTRKPGSLLGTALVGFDERLAPVRLVAQSPQRSLESPPPS
ncbi:MAG: tRNA pseudouridine(55) synthase TruB [Burkholderiaceae bacterium]